MEHGYFYKRVNSFTCVFIYYYVRGRRIDISIFISAC